MEHFHVFDVTIDRPHIKQTLYMPMYIRHVTGVMFFPVVPPPKNGIPDGNPLGTAGFSVENEKLNIVTNVKVYKKSPVYFESTDYRDAGGEIYLDKGYTYNDFYSCNDEISPNSFAIFKYTNRKLVLNLNDAERFNADYRCLQSLIGKTVVFHDRIFTPVTIENRGEIIRIRTNRFFQDYEILKSRLAVEIYAFLDPATQQPFFKQDDSEADYDNSFIIKTIIRYDQ